MEPDSFSTLHSNLESFISRNASLSPSVDRRLSEGRDRICLILQHLPKTHIAQQLVPTRCLININMWKVLAAFLFFSIASW